MKLYLPNGYVDIEEVIKLPVTFVWMFGPRGSGKTFGILKYLIEHRVKGRPFLHLRRRETEIDLLVNPDPEDNPFQALKDKCGFDIQVKRRKTMLNYYLNDELIGKAAALSTFAAKRSMDFSRTDAIFYDEYIPEKHVPWIKDESTAILNLYESVCRNRELDGFAPVRFLAAANSNDAANPYFLFMQCVTRVEKMVASGEELYINKERDYALINVAHSPIAEKKKETALYKFARGSDYEKMALYNQFAYDDFSCIASRDLKMYKPVVSIGEITIYKHKSEPLWYVTEHRSGAPVIMGTNDREMEKFREKYWRLYDRYIDGKLEFENYLTKTVFLLYFK